MRYLLLIYGSEDVPDPTPEEQGAVMAAYNAFGEERACPRTRSWGAKRSSRPPPPRRSGFATARRSPPMGCSPRRRSFSFSADGRLADFRPG